MSRESSENHPTQPNVFLCPFCRKVLSHLDHTIVQLEGRLSCETFAVTTTFSLSATLGAYGAIPADAVELKPGAWVDFLCPHCERSFTSRHNDRLSVIHMIDGTGREMAVLFDRVHGEHSSFVVDMARCELIGAYGEHSGLFRDELSRTLNFFGS